MICFNDNLWVVGDTWFGMYLINSWHIVSHLEHLLYSYLLITVIVVVKSSPSLLLWRYKGGAGILPSCGCK